MNAQQILSHIRGFMLDLDGTLSIGGQLLPAARHLLDTLRELELPWLCLTNNSSAHTDDYLKKLREQGIELAASQVLTSGRATIDHLLKETPYRSAYVVGTPALEREFREAGLTLQEDDPNCLVVGYDKTLTYHKLVVATRLLFADKPYFSTHPDQTCISQEGLLPDIAAIVAGLEAVTGRSPQVVGKPAPTMVAAAASRLGVPADTVAMVGDQLDTDMTMAARCNIPGILVFSGETDEEAVSRSAVAPTLVLRDVGQLADLLRSAAGGR